MIFLDISFSQLNYIYSDAENYPDSKYVLFIDKRFPIKEIYHIFKFYIMIINLYTCNLFNNLREMTRGRTL